VADDDTELATAISAVSSGIFRSNLSVFDRDIPLLGRRVTAAISRRVRNVSPCQGRQLFFFRLCLLTIKELNRQLR
jgi:hypothetical protein